MSPLRVAAAGSEPLPLLPQASIILRRLTRDRQSASDRIGNGGIPPHSAARVEAAGSEQRPLLGEGGEIVGPNVSGQVPPRLADDHRNGAERDAEL
jgi:hypothetical protein